jgi:hypothetical protein
MQHEMTNQDIFSEAQVAQRVWGGGEDLSANLKRLAPPPPVPNISTLSPILKVEIVDEEKEESFDEDDEEFGDFVSAPVKPALMPMPISKPIHTLVPENPFKQPIYAVREDEEDDLLLPKSDSSDLDSDVSQFLWLELLARDAAARTVQRHDKNALIQLPADDEDDMASDVLEFLKPARQVACDAAARIVKRGGEHALTDQNLAKLQAELRLQDTHVASTQQRWLVQQMSSQNEEMGVDVKDKKKDVENIESGNVWEIATASTATLVNVVKTDSAKYLGLLPLSGEIEEEAIEQLQSWRDAER